MRKCLESVLGSRAATVRERFPLALRPRFLTGAARKGLSKHLLREVCLGSAILTVGTCTVLAGCAADAGAGKTGPGAAAERATPQELDVLLIDPAVDHFQGDLSAPNVIIEYGNFLCSHCAAFFADHLPDVLALVDRGQAVYVYRHFVGSEAAAVVAQAAECAAVQNEDPFFPYHDRLFNTAGSLSADVLRQYAVDLGLDLDAFNRCMDNADTAGKVAVDVAGGVTLGVSGTPTFFVNGQMLVGNQPIEAFEALIPTPQ